MKKDCETCLKHDRNHHAADCLYCVQSNKIDIPRLLARHFNDGSGWDEGTDWPSVVQVDGKYFIKKYEAGHFGDIGRSHYEALEYNCLHLALEELVK